MCAFFACAYEVIVFLSEGVRVSVLAESRFVRVAFVLLCFCYHPALLRSLVSFISVIPHRVFLIIGPSQKWEGG